jgi:ribosomal protein S18 acetylase RimI-like enzyme
MEIRDARKTEASDLAILIDAAAHDIASWVWQGMRTDEASLFEVGRKRAMREEGGFSYRNAKIADIDGAVAGMIIGYTLDNPYDLSGLDDTPAEFRPLLELESLAPGSWYVNVLAVFEEYRRKGIGLQLLNAGEAIARECEASEMSIIIESANIGARKLYESVGYSARATRKAQPFPGSTLDSDEWVLLVKELKS